MKLTAADLKRLGVIEQIIEEPEKFTIDTLFSVTENMDRRIEEFLTKKMAEDRDNLLQKRYERFRRM